MKKQIDDLIDLLNSYNLVKTVSDTITGINIENLITDSRYVTTDSLFVCKGDAFKIEYLEAAYHNGAIAYISENVYNIDIPYIIVTDVRKALSIASRWYFECPGDDMRLVGITGTKGKTTTAYILKDILDKEKSNDTALFSTVCADTGKECHVTHLTTPESINVQEYYKEAREYGYHNVVMEVSSQAMKYDRLYGQKFSMGIFLNIDRDHIGGNEHASMEEYLDCKLSFLKNCSTVVINKHTQHLDKVLEAVKDKEIILFGYDDDCDAVISDVKSNMHGSTFTLDYKGKKYDLATNLIGSFNIDNLAAAITAALSLGVHEDAIRNGITDISVPGRMTIYQHKGINIVVDYAHNKLSVLNLYKTVQDAFKPKKIVSVFGCAGGRSKVRRKDLGILAD
ncbi:MAG: Mur ligase family protein, partial [Coprococcus sp.]